MFNRAKQLSALLSSFEKIAGKQPIEIIFVDSYSTDGTRELIDGWMDQPHPFNVLHVLVERSGIAKARNEAIKRASGDIIACTDSDCIVDPYWLDFLYNKLVSDPSYVAVGGSVRPVSDDIYSKYFTFFKNLEPPVSGGNVPFVVGANCMFRRKEAIEAGGFDESCGRYGGEEVSLCFALQYRGYRLGFEKDAVVFHDYRAELKDFYKTSYSYGYGNRIVLEKFDREIARTSNDASLTDPVSPDYYKPVHRTVLRSPVFTVRYLFDDFRVNLSSFKKERIPVATAFMLSLLRIVYYFAYTRGWYRSQSLICIKP